MRSRLCSNPVCGMTAVAVGIASVVASALILTFFQEGKQLVWELIRGQLAVTQGTIMFGLWKEPPINPILQVYVYNFTNLEGFLNGTESVARVEELGPYAYHAKHENEPEGWEGGRVSFRSRTTYESVPNLGRDDEEVVVVPNLVMFTGMLRRDVVSLPDFVKSNVVWPILKSVGRKTPVLKIKVREFLWGYEDELACIKGEAGRQQDGGRFFEEGEQDDFFDSREVTESGELVEPSEPSYVNREIDFRDPASGKCLFGILVERNATWSGLITANDGSEDIQAKGRVESIDGQTELGAWQKGSRCDAITGMQDPTLTSPLTRNQTERVFVNAMCRAIPFQDLDDDRQRAQHARRLSPPSTTFHPQSDPESCYFAEDDVDEIPEGVLPIAKCCQGCPLAVSFPHFLHASPWFRKQVRGVKEPSKSRDEPFMDVEPKLGALVGVQVRFQVNILMRRDEAFPPLSSIDSESSLSVVPLFWAEEGYDTLPADTLSFIGIALRTPDVLPPAALFLSTIIAISCLVTPFFTCFRYRSAGDVLRCFFAQKRTEIDKGGCEEPVLLSANADESPPQGVKAVDYCDRNSPLLPRNAQ